jgi:hypothetical protein
MFCTLWRNNQIAMQRGYRMVALASILAFVSVRCTFFGDKVLAECDNQKLFQEDYLNYLSAYELNDSQEELQSFIDIFIEGCLIQKELRTVAEQKFIRNKFRAERFLHEKNIFELENMFIDEHLDTVVTEEQIIRHYRNNRSNYIQQSFIVKALYLKIPDSLPENDIIEASFMLKNDKEREKINKYGNIYGLSFYWEEEKWIFLDDLIREIPITESAKERLVLRRGEGIFKDDNYRYYLNIFDYRTKESKEPLSFERNEIRNHILKRRINELRDEAQKKILKELHEKYNFNSTD